MPDTFFEENEFVWVRDYLRMMSTPEGGAGMDPAADQ